MWPDICCAAVRLETHSKMFRSDPLEETGLESKRSYFMRTHRKTWLCNCHANGSSNIV